MKRAAWTIFLCAACGEPAGDPSAAGPTTTAPEPAASSRDRDQALVHLRALASLELDPIETRERACDDTELALQAPGEAARALTTRVVEARAEARTLLPLSINAQLESVSLAELEEGLHGLSTSIDPARAEREVGRLGEQRFVGVFHVTRFQQPKWIWRLDRKRPEWVAGHLETWLAVHDAQSGERLCQTRILVIGDTTDAPLTSRHKSETQQRLTTALGTELRARVPAALGRLSAVLTLSPRLGAGAATAP
ncbi:MAG: hypothetical protein KF718_30955 [Polyangiaceae bacterium]|nr:hypothetical protein [Polyangiaceae bacterium]